MSKIKYGLKNVYWAKVTVNGDGSVSYGTPVAQPGAVNLTLKQNVERTPIAADDDPEYALIYDNKGYEGDLEIQILTDTFRREVLGEELDVNDVQYEKADASPNNIALLFEFQTDKNNVRHVLYNCSVIKPDVDSATVGDKGESKTDTLTFSSTPAKDTGIIKAKSYSDGASYNTWFDSVYVVGGSPKVLVTPTSIVFDKKTANQKDCVFNLFLGGGQTLSSIKRAGVALTTTTHYTNTGGVVTIKDTYLAPLAVGVHDFEFKFSDNAIRNVTITVIDTTA